MRQQQTTLESRIRHTGKARLYPKVITNEQKQVHKISKDRREANTLQYLGQAL